MTLGVPPNSVNEMFTSIVFEVLGADRCDRDLRVQDDDFVRKLRIELGVLQET